MMYRPRRLGLVLIVVIFLVAAPAWAAEPFRYTEGKHGKGELKYLNGVAVLRVEGTPEEIGEQVALLTKSASRLLDYPREVVTALVTPLGANKLWPRFVEKG